MNGTDAGRSAPRLVLASGSATRRDLLAAAGLAFDVHPSQVDEDVLKIRLRGDRASPSEAALALALAKADAVSRLRPDDLVIGADQILVCDGRWYDKPADLGEARRHLESLRGRAQVLHTACVLMGPGVPVWRHVACPRLTMRMFSDAAIDTYLEAEGEAVCTSVGACRIEGPGYLMFSSIKGDHAAILGLPLLALADELRLRGFLPT